MSSHRNSGAIECPLASLGRTPSLDQSYHHPLSTSPLNPQAYQMLRKSQESPILSLDADKIRFTAARRPAAVVLNGGDQTYPPPRHHASTPSDGSAASLLSRRDLQRIRNQTYTPIDSVLPSYQQATTAAGKAAAATIQQAPFNESSSVAIGLHHEITDVERFFLGDKMASLIIDSAIRSNNNRSQRTNSSNSSSSNNTNTNHSTGRSIVPGGGGNNGSAASIATSNANNRSSLSDVDRIESADRYFLDQQDRSSNDGGGYNYYSIPKRDGCSPTLRRRASSPDTSGSDRYFLDRLRGSPAFVSRNAKVANIKSTDSPSSGR